MNDMEKLILTFVVATAALAFFKSSIQYSWDWQQGKKRPYYLFIVRYWWLPIVPAALLFVWFIY